MRKWLEKLKNPMLRFKLAVGIALVILSMGFAVLYEGQQQAIRRDCVERTERARATAPALAKLVEAHRLDKDPHATAVWRQYLDAANKNPLPKC